MESGRVRVLLPSGAGQHELGIAGPGTVLGLSETVSHGIYKVTAIADDRARVSFIARRDFVRFLQEHEKFCLQMVELLSAELHGLYSKFVILSKTSYAPMEDETGISSNQ